MLLESMYVDDFAGGASNDFQALRVHCKSQELMSQGGFIFRKGHCNSAYVRDYIAAQDDCNEGSKGTATQSEHYQIAAPCQGKLLPKLQEPTQCRRSLRQRKV